ncbi:hypothetical protein L873DRAFT_1920171 [Choiromyces venosus 120613-1]|uniref:Phosphatidic acid phosphatase type 2/haloperoxidase domain-containing protein n=1 Tax=Choiromyces venosus 120613-1 TaxID=1336337 RepID=A0A3N4JU31_9PEZI|nr:hypothetical protein L873DRAFT_1920171 [Choiromyces venosus 120613-1]
MSGFLSRFRRGASPATEKHAHTGTMRDAEAGEEHEGWIDPYGGPPTVKQWFRWYWHDVVAFIFLGAISLWLLIWSPIPYRKLFAVTVNPGNGVDGSSEIVNPSFAYPKRKQVIPIIADAMIAVFVPIISIVLTNIIGIATHGPDGKRLRMAGKRGGALLGRGSFWNLVIGGLRPHFLTVCDPQIDGVKGMGYGGLYFDTSVCRDHSDPKRRDEIANAMQSSPSGHSMAAWAGLFYLSLYFNAHLKIFSNYHPSYWKLLLFVTPMLAATLIVGSLTLDMSHNRYDIVVGSVMGVAMAILSYRMCFASVWDFRFNHIPLARDPRIPGFNYNIEELEDWGGGCATRRGGWGVARRYARFNRGWGAPGDCAF